MPIKAKTGAHSSQLYGSQPGSYNSKLYCTHSDPKGSLLYERVENYCQRTYLSVDQVKTLLRKKVLVGKKFKNLMFVAENPNHEKS
ncbi:MAG: hypothetical protein AAGA60_30965 [Cyanobacteria bacterium P01_E01_bin.42]